MGYGRRLNSGEVTRLLEEVVLLATVTMPGLTLPRSPSSVIHRTQLWFHGRISREESHRIIKQQGLVDG